MSFSAHKAHGSSLGFGLGYRPDHFRQLSEAKHPDVDWLEVLADNFSETGNKLEKQIDQLAELYPLTLHTVGLSIAGREALNQEFLSRLKYLNDTYRPKFLSDHLCWSQLNGRHFYDLLPIPYTKAMISHVADRLKQVQDFLGVRFYLENPSAYLAFEESEMGEAEFLAELCHRAESGLLIDPNNLYVNYKNLGVDFQSYLKTIKDSPICYLHLAGHTDLKDILIDTHGAPVTREVWEVYELAIKELAIHNTLIEWDEDIPEFEVLHGELNKARQLAEKINLSPHTQEESVRQDLATNEKPSDAFQKQLERFILAPLSQELEAELDIFKVPEKGLTHPKRGVIAYRTNYRGCLWNSVEIIFPQFLAFIDRKTCEDLFEIFISTVDTPQTLAESMMKLISFIRESSLKTDNGADQKILADLMLFEWCLYSTEQRDWRNNALTMEDLARLTADDWPEAVFNGDKNAIVLESDSSPHILYKNIENQTNHQDFLREPQNYLFFGSQGYTHYLFLTPWQTKLWKELLSGKTFAEVCEVIAGDDQKRVIEIVEAMTTWVDKGIIEIW